MDGARWLTEQATSTPGDYAVIGRSESDTRETCVEGPSGLLGALGLNRASREHVDLAAGVIHVRRGWDYVAGEIATKSGKDRKVPIAGVLRDYLDEQLGLAWREQPEGLVFGRPRRRRPGDLDRAERAKRAWKKAKIAAITLHECRHTAPRL